MSGSQGVAGTGEVIHEAAELEQSARLTRAGEYLEASAGARGAAIGADQRANPGGVHELERREVDDQASGTALEDILERTIKALGGGQVQLAGERDSDLIRARVHANGDVESVESVEAAVSVCHVALDQTGGITAARSFPSARRSIWRTLSALRPSCAAISRNVCSSPSSSP